MPRIDLDEIQLTWVRRLVGFHLPPCRAYAFGSRVQGRAVRHSDLDVAVDAGARIDLAALGQLREALSASDLSIRVDVVDLQAVDATFRQSIAAQLVPLL